MTIYWIEGDFWKWKTSTAVYLAKTLSRKYPWCLIISNIIIETSVFTNYCYFNDDELANTLRSMNWLNDLERELYTRKITWKSLLRYDRKKFTKMFLLFDEAWAIMNNKEHKAEDKNFPDYINQNRKNFSDIYCITADGAQSAKTIRRFIEWYLHPTDINLPIINDFWIVYRVRKDAEWNIVQKEYVWKDQNGDYVTKKKPERYFHDFYYKPFIRNLYDDLHKNIRDKGKYTNINYDTFKLMLKNKPELVKIIKENPKYETMKANLYNE